MVEITDLSIEELEKQKELVTALTAQYNLSAEAAEKQAVILAQMPGTVKELVDSYSKFPGIIDTGIRALREKHGLFGTMNAVIAKTKELVSNNTAEIFSFGAAITEIIPTGEKSFSDLGKAGTLAGSSVAESFSGLQRALTASGAAGGVAAKAIGRVAASADQARELELSILANAAAAGRFGTVLQRTGDDFRELENATATHIATIKETSLATGTSSAKTAEYADILSKVPGPLGDISRNTNVAGTATNNLEAILKVSAGTMQDVSEVTNQVGQAFLQLGTSGNKALELVASMQRASQDLGLPMDLVRDYTMKTGEAFKFLGDNTQGAIKIMGGVSSALKDSNLGPAAITELTSGITSGIHQMDIAHKAFISSASGGPGGLAGGLGIDLLLQQGKIQEVVQMTETAMKEKFGGPVLTLQDATSNPALAGEFYKQVSFLKDVAGVAKSDQEAYRILEAMKTGSIAGVEGQLATPEAALQDAVERGSTLQERNNTVLNTMQIQFDSMVQAMHLQNLLTIRQTVGSDAANEYLNGIMSNASERAQALDVGNEGNAKTAEDQKESMKASFGTLKEKMEKTISATSQFAQSTLGFKVKETKDIKEGTQQKVQEEKKSSGFILDTMKESITTSAPLPIPGETPILTGVPEIPGTRALTATTVANRTALAPRAGAAEHVVAAAAENVKEAGGAETGAIGDPGEEVVGGKVEHEITLRIVKEDGTPISKHNIDDNFTGVDIRTP